MHFSNILRRYISAYYLRESLEGQPIVRETQNRETVSNLIPPNQIEGGLFL